MFKFKMKLVPKIYMRRDKYHNKYFILSSLSSLNPSIFKLKFNPFLLVYNLERPSGEIVRYTYTYEQLEIISSKKGSKWKIVDNLENNV